MCPSESFWLFCYSVVPQNFFKTGYREYLEGASFLQTKRSLEADGIENGAGHRK